MSHKLTLEYEHPIFTICTDVGRCSKALTGIKWAIVILLVTVFPVQAWCGGHRQPAKAPAVTDPGYVLALGAANRFLHAWEIGDLESGMLLLSDRARTTLNADAMEEYFAAGEDRGFEIQRGSGRAGRYRFPVALVTKQKNTARRIATEIVLVNTGRNEWAVDRLP